MKVVARPYYMSQLVAAMGNSMIKIITGVRRAGKSYLLFRLFYVYLLQQGIEEDHIIRIALDDLSSEPLLDPLRLLQAIRERVKDSDTYYVLLDEIQLVRDFPKVLNSLLHDENVDVYVTGSNSRFLSQDVATEFRGRGDEIHIYPFSFSEYLSTRTDRDVQAAYMQYVRYGGLPQVVELPTDQKKTDYLSRLFSTVYARDIVERYQVQKTLEFDELMEIVASSVGSLINPRRLANAFQSVGHSSLSPETISRFLSHAQDAFLIERAMRYDIKGKRYINTLSKYYFSDLGLRNALLNFRQVDEGHLMENAVYNELRMRGYRVDVGQVEVFTQGRTVLEVDFVAQRGSSCYYMQSALYIPDSDKMTQETASLRRIGNSFKKILLVRDQFLPWHTEEGILVLSLFDFFLSPEAILQ